MLSAQSPRPSLNPCSLSTAVETPFTWLTMAIFESLSINFLAYSPNILPAFTLSVATVRSCNSSFVQESIQVIRIPFSFASFRSSSDASMLEGENRIASGFCSMAFFRSLFCSSIFSSLSGARISRSDSYSSAAILQPDITEVQKSLVLSLIFGI